VNFLIDHGLLYLGGAWTTLRLLLAALLAGALLAVPLAVLRSLHNPWAWRPVWLFTWVMRGTPMLVQLFLLYYGLAQFEAVRQSSLWPLLGSAWFCAIAAFALNTCAYTTEMLHGAIRSLSPGEIEAGRALGMSQLTLMRRVILPSALRRAIPAYGNEVVMMLHGTSLASVVTLLDVTGVARELNARTYLPFEAFVAAAVLYVLLSSALVALCRHAEKRWLAPMLSRS
jgi:arginine/ornithine transport system permease protein